MKTLVAEFAIDGEPMSKARARFTNYKSKTRAYTPERTRVAEERILAAYLKVASPNPDPEVAFGVEVEFLHQTGQRRDIDNMLKLILDALNKVAFHDDVQVTQIAATKRRVPKGEAQTIVRLYNLGRVEKPRGKCIQCGAEFAQFASTRARKYCTRQCGYAYSRANRAKVCVGCGIEFNPHSAANLYCTKRCCSEHKRATLTCVTCDQVFTTPQSLANKGVPACSPECRGVHHAARRTENAKGVCGDCGGPTASKRAARCRACHIEARGAWGANRRIKKADDAA